MGSRTHLGHTKMSDLSTIVGMDDRHHDQHDDHEDVVEDIVNHGSNEWIYNDYPCSGPLFNKLSPMTWRLVQ